MKLMDEMDTSIKDKNIINVKTGFNHHQSIQIQSEQWIIHEATRARSLFDENKSLNEFYLRVNQGLQCANQSDGNCRQLPLYVPVAAVFLPSNFPLRLVQIFQLNLYQGFWVGISHINRLRPRMRTERCYKLFVQFVAFRAKIITVKWEKAATPAHEYYLEEGT